MLIKRLVTHYVIGLSFTILLFVACQDHVSLPTQPAAAKVWDKTFGGNGGEGLSTILATLDSGVLLTGFSSSRASGDKTQDNIGGWVVKINEEGNKQWDKVLGENLRSVVATPDGGYLLGETVQSNYLGMNGLNFNVIKIGADGVKQWDKTFGGSADDQLSSVVTTSDGGFLLGGTSNSNVSGDKSQNSKNNYNDYWVIKINADGVKQWDKTFGGSADDQLSSVVTTSDGGFLLGGTSRSDASGDKSQNSKGGYGDYWIIKINKDGARQWDRTFGGSSFDELISIVTTSDDGFLLAGSSSSDVSGDKTQDRRSYDLDYWIIRIGEDGAKQWDKTLGGNSSDQLSSVVTTSDDGFLLAGFSNSNASGDKSQNTKGSYDYWLIKVNRDGAKIWDKTLGGSKSDYSPSLARTPDGSFLIGGTSSSNTSDDKSQDCAGEADYWIIKIK